MKYADILARILVGLVFTVFGLNGLMLGLLGKGFIPMPPMPPSDGTTFVTILLSSHWVVVVDLCEFVGGLLLLSGQFVPLGLTLLSPVLVNILCYHLLLEPDNLPMAVVLCALDGFLISRRWDAFRGLVQRK